MRHGRQFEQPGLGRGGVLVFIHEHEAMLVADRPRYLGSLEGGHRQGEQSPVIDAPPGLQLPVVALHEVGKGAPLRPVDCPFPNVVRGEQSFPAAEKEVAHLLGQGLGSKQGAVERGPGTGVFARQEFSYQGDLLRPGQKRRHLLPVEDFETVGFEKAMRERVKSGCNRTGRGDWRCGAPGDLTGGAREKARISTSAGAAISDSTRWRALLISSSVLPVPGPATISCGP